MNQNKQNQTNKKQTRQNKKQTNTKQIKTKPSKANKAKHKCKTKQNIFRFFLPCIMLSQVKTK